MLNLKEIYKSVKDANPALKGIKPELTLEQMNLVADWADSIAKGDNPPDNEWAVAIANFKKAYTVRKGAWVKRETDTGAVKPASAKPETAAADMVAGESEQPAPPADPDDTVDEYEETEERHAGEPRKNGKVLAEVKALRKEVNKIKTVLATLGEVDKPAEPPADATPATDTPAADGALVSQADTDKQAAIQALTDEFNAFIQHVAVVLGVVTKPEADEAPEDAQPEDEAPIDGQATEAAAPTSEAFTESASFSGLAPDAEATAIISEVVASGELQESAANIDKRAPVVVDLKIIKPGPGNERDNHYYPAEMLQRCAKVFEGADLFSTEHSDAERGEKTKVGKIRNVVRFDEDGSPIGRAIIYDPDMAEKTRNRAASGDLNTLECSILGDGNATEQEVNGKKYKVVSEITKVPFVEFVSKAGAGGHAIAIAESAVPTTAPAVEVEKPAQSVTPPALDSTEVARIVELSGLPKASRVRLAEQAYPTEAELELVISAEREYVSELTHSGAVFGNAPARPPAPVVRSLKEHDADLDNVITKHFGK